MKREKFKELQQLIDIAGSTTKLAAMLDVHALTIENWRRRGIPTKYWDKIGEIYGASPEELYAITIRCQSSQG